MKMPQNADGWRKVRELHNVWAHQVIYYISTKVYLWIALIGGIVTLYFLFSGEVVIGGNKIFVIVVLVTVYALGKVSERHQREEGYVNGFQQGIEYVDEDFTLDELIKTSSKTDRKEKTAQPSQS